MLIAIMHSTSIIYTAIEGASFFIKRIKRKGCRSNAIEMIAQRDT